MSYFVSDDIQIRINQRIRNLIKENEELEVNLDKHQKELGYLKKHFIFNFFKGYYKRLELLIDEEELSKEKIVDVINCIQEINAKVKSLVSVLYGKGEEKSIFNEEVYYECMALYKNLSLELAYLVEEKIDVGHLKEVYNFLEKVYNYYATVNFDNPDFNYYLPLSLEDCDILMEYSTFVEYICDCFKNNVSFDNFMINAKKYLTYRENNRCVLKKKILSR